MALSLLISSLKSRGQAKVSTDALVLLGPRQVGKSSLMKNQLQDQVRLSSNLFDGRISMEASVNPIHLLGGLESAKL